MMTEKDRLAFNQQIMDAADAALRRVNANRETLIEAWLAETGILPSEAMLVEQRMNDGTIRFWVEKRKP
jgi:hypothetical protein